MSWPNLEVRLRDRKIARLRYEPEAAFTVIELEGGDEAWVSSDREEGPTYYLPAGSET